MGPTWAIGNMNHNVPETLPELSFPEPQASRSVEGNAAWGLCSQHQMCLKIAEAWFPRALCPLASARPLHLRLIASVPWAPPWLLEILFLPLFQFC